MFVSLVMSSTLLGLSLAQSVVPEILKPTPSTSDATITPAPDHLELLRRENNDRYMGWVSYDGTWYSQQCDLGGTYFQTSDYWRCCTTTANGCAKNNIPVGCISGSLIYSMTVSTLSQTLFTFPCTSIFTGSTAKSFTICNTLFMFENEGDSSPLTNVNCGAQSLRWSYYRVAPYAATAISSPSLAPSSPTVRSSPATPTPLVTDPPVPTPVPEPSKSKAWIAGAVVGPIIGLALIAFAAFLFLRHKKNKQNQTHPAVGGVAGQPSQMHSPGPQSPPQYYAPMAQKHDAAGMAPFGVAKHESWLPPHSPNTQGSMSPNPGYGAPPPPGWQHDQNHMNIGQTQPLAGQPGYGPLSPSMSPPPGHGQPYNADTGMFKHTGETVRPFSSELEGSHVQHQTMPGPAAPGPQPGTH